ncbi:TonB-dependent receptor [Sphingomonas elodea]|uniref:TonB-dependent receptor n=1 Tax=Sphingomonas elodea TaxID=179878 RepID=UPI000263137E|nr:TonB-dependent receptor [Sphingomonas elodea]
MRTHYLAGVAAAALLIPVAAHAQETTSTIRGTVTANGAPVADATVVTIHVPSGTRSQVKTDAEGNFNVAGLRTGGPYTVEVTSASGNQTVTDIYTVVQQVYALPIDLAATADAGAEIVVTASRIKGAGITSNGPSTVLDALQISKVASVNRDIRDIQRRDPFATLDVSNSGDRGGAVSFAGVNPRFNRFTINGVTVGDTFGLNQDASPNIRGPVPFDALAQVSVSVAPYDFRQSGFQGGAIDTVLKSGTNEFHGTGFYSQNTDGLSGTKIGSTVFARPKFKSETYGATLSGPIIKDKLFFMISGERNTDPRPYSTLVASYANPAQLNQAITDISAIAKSTYSIEPGTALTINDRKDEKVVARVDWNVMTGQKLSFSYVNSYNVQGSQNNTSLAATTYGLSTNAYALSELLRAGILQLNSDWTSNFSTEARLIYRWTRRGQEPFGGRPNGQLGVCYDAASAGTISTCSAGIPTVTFGPDNSRQTNQLFYDTWAGSFATRYQAGNHEIRALIDVTQNRTFNNFVQNSLGSWYFDSLADFQARRAGTLQYSAIIGGGNSAAANFHYTAYTLGAQDDWQVNDALRITAGVRYTMYGMRDLPTLNPYFTQRYGFSNLKTYKGLDQFEPRLSFEFKPAAKPFSFRGGAGIFGGGSPDIYLSNSFSNTITTNSLVITRSASGANTCTGGVPDAICQAALNNVTGKVSDALAAYASDTANNPNIARTNTGAIARDFHLPRSLKATLSGDLNLWGFNFGADYYYSNTLDTPIFVDARSVQVGTLPDGRPRYNGLLGFSDNNFDILVTSAHKGRSHIGVVRFDKKFDWGLSFGGSYTLQDVRDVGNATSSTINSNFRNQFFADPNFPVLGTSSDQIKWSYKYNIGFDHAFFGDYRTVIQLFGETRAGRPYSFTMRDTPTNRTGVFGTVLTGGTTNTNLLYVPKAGTDAIVQYDSEATKNALESLINSTALKNYRGQIAPKNIARNRAFTQIDLHLEQEIPTFVGRSRLSVFADINNVPNLINKNWGGLRQFGFPYAGAVVTVNCVNTAGVVIPSTAAIGAPTATGAATTANPNPANGCAKYQYSNFQPVNSSAVNFNGSFYAIRVGARFTF